MPHTMPLKWMNLMTITLMTITSVMSYMFFNNKIQLNNKHPIKLKRSMNWKWL